MLQRRICSAIILLIVGSVLATSCTSSLPEQSAVMPSPTTPVPNPYTSTPSPLSPTPSATTQTVNNIFLQQALALTPATAQRVFFTDWQTVKTQTKHTSLRGTSPFRERLDFSKSYGDGWDSLSLCAALHINIPQNNWGWDFTDLMWEARINLGESASVCVLALPNDFDITAVSKLYQARQFTQTLYHETTIFTATQEQVVAYSPDLDPNFLLPELLNAAFLPNDDLLLLSDNVQHIYNVIDVHQNRIPSLWATPNVDAVVSALGPIASGGIIPGANACADYRTDLMIDKHRDTTLKKLLAKNLGTELNSIHTYSMLGIGYTAVTQPAIINFAMAYTDATEAKADAPLRKTIAETGLSLTTRKPYRDSTFKLLDVTIQDEMIVLRLQSVRPNRIELSSMFARRDMLVAACPKP